MRQTRIFVGLSAEKSYLCTKVSSLMLSAFLIFFCLLFIVSPAHSDVSDTRSHGCAPDPPSPISNSILAPSTPGSIVINEVVSQPHSTWNCSEPSGVFSQVKDSWIELFNTQSQAFDLYAARAEVSLDGGASWNLLPFGSAIAPGGFLVVFPEEKNVNPVPGAAWNVVLAIGSAIIDQAAIPALQADQSYARVPDGSSTWQYVGQPTIDASNNSSGQPVTPTPTKTPTSTKTAKPTNTPKPPSGSSATGGSGANVPISAGTQPAWSGVQLPPGITPTSVTTDSTTATPPPLPQTQNAPVTQSSAPLVWLITVFVLLLLGMAFGCWRLFGVSAMLARLRGELRQRLAP